MKYSFFLLLFLTVIVTPQGRLVITYGDFVNDEIRVGLLDLKSGEIIDAGFNKTYLPAVSGDKLIFNSDRFLWESDLNGEGLKKINKGFRASISPDGERIAFYSESGIEICNKDFIPIKKIEINYTPDNHITWLPGNAGITFAREEETYAYFFAGDSIYKFGDRVVQPIWFNQGTTFVYSQMSDNGIFRVKEGWGKNTSGDDKELYRGAENTVAPQWSSTGKYIGFFRLLPEEKPESETDMIKAELVIYNNSLSVVAAVFKDAAFTDGVFPQFTFSKDDSTVYYTGMSKFGTGIIKEGCLYSGESKVVFEDGYIDIRFPVFYLPAR